MSTYAFTGHRPPKLGGYTEQVNEAVLNLALKFLLREKPSKVISGMALGWDTAVAKAAVVIGIPLVAACPCEGQPDVWPAQDIAMYRYLLGRASEVVVVSPGPYAHYKMIKRDEWMVDHGDKLIALWDGTRSGTGTTVAYAEKKLIPVINLWDEYQAMKN